MFCRCDLLESLPDISNWDMKNVTNISYMFEEKMRIIKTFA